MSADPEQRPSSCREFVEDLTGHSTRRGPSGASGGNAQEVWYLVYRDEAGQTHTVKGGTSAIRRSLKEGILGDAANVRASRIKSGPFEPLRDHPEFRDIVVSAAPLSGAGVGVSKGQEATAPISPSASTDKAVRVIPPPLPAGPHIDLGAGEQGTDWRMWAALVLVAVATAVGHIPFPDNTTPLNPAVPAPAKPGCAPRSSARRLP